MARPRQISDEQILSVMRENVLRHGPTVSLELVASELKVSPPALLKRFENRQSLMIAALKPPENPEWSQKLLEGPNTEPLEQQLRAIFFEISEFMRTVVPCITALRESGIPIDQVWAKRKMPEHGFKALQRWLELARKQKLVTATEFESCAYAILGALQMRAFFAHMNQLKYSEREEREYVHQLARLFNRALTS